MTLLYNLKSLIFFQMHAVVALSGIGRCQQGCTGGSRCLQTKFSLEEDGCVSEREDYDEGSRYY